MVGARLCHIAAMGDIGTGAGLNRALTAIDVGLRLERGPEIKVMGELIEV